MNHLSTAGYSNPVAKLRFHPRARLLAGMAGPHSELCVWEWIWQTPQRLLESGKSTMGPCSHWTCRQRMAC